TSTEDVWGLKKPEKETEKGLRSGSWCKKVVTGNEGGWGAKKLVNDSEKAARSGSSWGQKVLWALKKRGQHFGNQDQSILLRRSDHWRDVKNRVIRKPSRTSVASNSTTGQGLINPPEEHVGCAYGGKNSFSKTAFIPVNGEPFIWLSNIFTACDSSITKWLHNLEEDIEEPLDLHPRLPDPGFTMDHLPDNAIGIHIEFLRFSGVHRRAIPDYLTWRHSCSFVLDDLSTDGYDRNDVEQLCAHLICLHETREEVLVRSGLSSMWFNKECDPMFRRIADNAGRLGGDAKVAEEPHHLSLPLLERVLSHTTAPTAEGAMIPLPTPYEIAASLPDPRLAKKSKGPSQARVCSTLVTGLLPLNLTEGVDEADLTDFYAKIENSLEKDEGTSARAALTLTPRLGKRLGAPPSVANVSAFGPSHGGTLVHASTSGRDLSLRGMSKDEVLRRQVDPLDFLARSSLARDVEYDQILEDDFGTATRGEEIDLTLFPLTPGPYQMSYSYEGASSPPYTREEWNGHHAPEGNLLCKDIFKDPDVCWKALDRTITPAKLKRSESLILLDLANRFNVLSALLVSYGAELNSRYTGLVSARNRLQEKFDRKVGYVKVLRSKVIDLDGKLERMQKDCAALVLENRELHSQKDVASVKTDAKLSDLALVVRDLQNQLALEKARSQGYKDAMDGLREEVTQFIGSGVGSLVRKLLSSDEFHAALARVASLGINYSVERGLRMGRTDVEFEAAVQKVSNFHVGAKADFHKALVDFPTTPFPFLNKIDAASGGTLSKVTQVLLDKHIRSVIPASAISSIVNEDADQVLIERASDASTASI
ncbi:hypothetical protein Tco_0853069, partial [Tanacetum coccineum]